MAERSRVCNKTLSSLFASTPRRSNVAVFSRRLRQLRQSRVGTGSHSGHERLPDRHEAAEGAAEALQERQQTLLILALGLSAPPVSTARVSLPPPI